MNAEDRASTKDIITHSSKCKNCAFVVSDRIQKLFKDASINRNLNDILRTNAELNRSMLDYKHKHKPAPVYAGITHHQSYHLWSSIFMFCTCSRPKEVLCLNGDKMPEKLGTT